MTPRQADLNPWNDTDELIRTLGMLDEEPNPQLVDDVSELLEHADPDVREEALRLLLVRWKIRRLRYHAVNLISSGETAEIRSLAAYGIAATSTEESRLKDVASLTTTLQRNDEDPSVKGAAYDALLIMFRKHEFPSKSSTFNAERDVDWEWVKSLPTG